MPDAGQALATIRFSTPEISGYHGSAATSKATIACCGTWRLGLWGTVRTLLGGVCLTISTSCAHPEVAARFQELITPRDFQGKEYVARSGQPGRLSAWRSAPANAVVGDFFVNTLSTVTRSFLRPRGPDSPPFQRIASHRLNKQFKEGAPPSRVSRDLMDAWIEAIA